jgi:hypothetical protein
MTIHAISTSIAKMARRKGSFLIAMSTLIFALNLDTVLIRVNPFTTSESLAEWRIVLFSIIVGIYLFGQYYALKIVNNNNREILSREKTRIGMLHKVILIIQYALGAVLLAVIYQMVSASRYDVQFLSVATGLSYSVAVALLVLLSARFLVWYKSDRNLVVGLYGLSSLALAASAAVTLVFVLFLLDSLPSYVYPHIGFNSPAPTPGVATHVLKTSYNVSSIVSFILTWVATAALLQHYSHKLGRIRFWLIISIPLVYFLSQFFPLIEIAFVVFSDSTPVQFNIIYTLVLYLSKPAGGIMFGIAFYIVSRRLGYGTSTRNYMITSAYGFILLFTSGQAVVLASAPYPPFGLPTVLIMGLSTYLILVGIYSTAISVAQDEKLRRSIKKLTLKETRLLESIGAAHHQEQVLRKIATLTKQFRDNMEEDSGVKSSLEENDMKDYIEEVLHEIERTKNKPR